MGLMREDKTDLTGKQAGKDTANRTKDCRLSRLETQRIEMCLHPGLPTKRGEQAITEKMQTYEQKDITRARR